MPTFAHTEKGYVLDPQENVSEKAYRARYPKKIQASWVVEQIPDGTVRDSIPDGQGGWTAPPPKARIDVKRVCTRDEVIDLLPGGLMKTLRDSTVAAVIKRFYKFQAKTSFTYEDGVELGDALQGATLITVQENSDFKTAWPVVKI